MSVQCHLLDGSDVVAEVLFVGEEHESHKSAALTEALVAQVGEDGLSSLGAVHHLQHGGIVLPGHLAHVLGVAFHRSNTS